MRYKWSLILLLLVFLVKNSLADWSEKTTVSNSLIPTFSETYYTEDPLYPKSRASYVLNGSLQNKEVCSLYKKIEVWAGYFMENTSYYSDRGNRLNLIFETLYYTVIQTWNGKNKPPAVSHTVTVKGLVSAFASPAGQVKEGFGAKAEGKEIHRCQVSSSSKTKTDYDKQTTKSVVNTKPKQNTSNQLNTYAKEIQEVDKASVTLKGNGKYWALRWIDCGFVGDVWAEGTNIDKNTITPSYAWASGVMYFSR